MKRLRFLTVWTVFLLLTWLLLQNTVAAGHLVLGAILGLGVAGVAWQMRPLTARPRRLLTIPVLIGHVLLDIVRSNIAVAQIVLGSKERRSNSGFMKIPLDMRDPHGLAMLACIITATPGTVWAGLTEDGSALNLHVLDLQDEQHWIDLIKSRYERPLMEIFE